MELLVEEIDLAAERLALLVHCPVSIDLGHEAPVVNGKFVELVAEGGKCGPTPTEGGNEPCG